MTERVILLDFGAQYGQLIARRIREFQVYCEVMPYNTPARALADRRPHGIILTGGPASVYGEGAPRPDPGVFHLGIPVLGICYGMQLMADMLGGRVQKAPVHEYGRTKVQVDEENPLFHGLGPVMEAWMSHADSVERLPDGFRTLARTDSTPVAALADPERSLWGVQFHPEVVHTPRGAELLRNFLFKVCRCEGRWTMASFVENSIEAIRHQVRDRRAICGLSGGVDSSVAALLVHRAIGDQLTSVFVDHGLLRKNEGRQVVETFGRLRLNLVHVDARERFLQRLEGVTDPERKRKIVGEEFIRVFEEEAERLGDVDYLVQGTVYPDVIESGTGTAAVIKSHHNVGGLPENMRLRLVEPLRELFKDEVRHVAETLGLPPELVWRHPFPGPGLAIRIIGEVTGRRLEALREADAIAEDEIRKAGLYRDLWQGFMVLSTSRSVGVMGDERTYAYTAVLRAVTSNDGMTADWVRLPYDLLERISSRVVNEVSDINRVVYDVTSKPPATIEWE